MMLRLFLCVSVFCSTVNAYKILIFMPTPILSYQLPAMGLTEALLEKGHQVFLAGSNELPALKGNKNYTYIDYSWLYHWYRGLAKDQPVQLNQHISKWDLVSSWDSALSPLGRKMFGSETSQLFFRRLLDKRITIDVIIIESLFIPFGVATARLLGTKNPLPVVSLATTTCGDPYGEDLTGSIPHLSYTLFSSYTDKTLWQRIKNWVSHESLAGKLRGSMEDSARALYMDSFGPVGETLVDGSWAEVSIALLATNSLYFYPRPLPPNVVEVGPLHMKKPEELPKVLQEWLDGASKGVIYISLGSEMKSEGLSKEVRSNFLKVFGQLPGGYRVLWRHENRSRISEQLPNVLFHERVPQQSILAHPRTRLFITQSCCQSFQEAVQYGVPTVAIPWFADQSLNAVKMADSGIGAQLLPRELLSYERVKSVIETVLFNERYINQSKRLSTVSWDLTSRAKNEAVFWVEHVARHRGAPLFRPATAGTTYFELFCLEIFIVIFIASVSIFYVANSVLAFLNLCPLAAFKPKSKIL